MTSEPDLVARGLAIAALALTLVQMYIGARRALWRRRAANVPELRRVLDEVRAVLDGATEQRGAGNLWTQAMAAHMAALLEQAAIVPDSRLVGLVRRVHDDVVAIRGMSTPSDDDLLDAGVALTDEQRRLLSRARTNLKAARARIAKCIRRGGLG